MENESEKELVVAEPIDTEEETVEESEEMEFSDTEKTKFYLKKKELCLLRQEEL